MTESSLLSQLSLCATPSLRGSSAARDGLQMLPMTDLFLGVSRNFTFEFSFVIPVTFVHILCVREINGVYAEAVSPSVDTL